MTEQQMDEIRERLTVLEERLHEAAQQWNTLSMRLDVLWAERKK